MRAAVLAVFFLLAATPASAQETSPVGYLKRGGSWNASFLLSGVQYQVVDNTLRAKGPRIINTIAWRRAATGGGLTSGPRTAKLHLHFGHTDFGRVSFLPEANYFVAGRNTKRLVFSGNVNLPDWRVAPKPPPAPFDLVVKIRQPFAYFANAAFVYEAEFEGSPLIGLADGVKVTQQAGSGRQFDSGCTKGPNAFVLDFALEHVRSGDHGMRLRAQALLGPTLAPALLIVGTTARLRIPGLCADLRVAPLIQLFAGVSDEFGRLSPVHWSWRAHRSLVGAKASAQLIALDPSYRAIPLRLSTAVESTMPAQSGPIAPQIYSIERFRKLGLGFFRYGTAPICRLAR